MALTRLSERQIIEACIKYRELCEAGTIKRADFWHFCAWIGETDAAISLIIEHGGKAVPDGAASADNGRSVARDISDNGRSSEQDVAEAAKYGEAAEELRRLCTYIRGQYSTSPGWSGASSNKALFNQRQNFDGRALVDKQERTTSGEISVKLVGNFGGVDDPFG